MKTYYPFNCKCCGECCKHIGCIEEMKEYDRGDGVCKYLKNDNKCSIYNNRPNLCNGKYVYEKYYSHLTVEEFHNMIRSLCNEIREKSHLERLY